jgi:hypothetical protein
MKANIRLNDEELSEFFKANTLFRIALDEYDDEFKEHRLQMLEFHTTNWLAYVRSRTKYTWMRREKLADMYRAYDKKLLADFERAEEVQADAWWDR